MRWFKIFGFKKYEKLMNLKENIKLKEKKEYKNRNDINYINDIKNSCSKSDFSNREEQENRKENKKESIRKKYIILIKSSIIIFAIISILILQSDIYAAQSTPKLINKIKTAFEKIQKYILIVATPIAGVALSTGLLMRKFSFGDEEKVRTSKKLIRGTIYSYVFILSTKFVLEFIQSLVK